MASTSGGPMQVVIGVIAALLAFAAGAGAAARDPAITCQRAIEGRGVRYARAMLRSVSDCVASEGGSVGACLDAAVAGPKPADMRARWESGIAKACSTTNVGSDLGYF